MEWLNLLLPLRRKVPPLILLSSSWTVWPSTADLRLSSLNSDTGWTCPTFKHYTCSGFKTNYLIESKKNKKIYWKSCEFKSYKSELCYFYLFRLIFPPWYLLFRQSSNNQPQSVFLRIYLAWGGGGYYRHRSNDPLLSR